MSGTLAFRYFPAQTWRPSGVYAEFDPSQANTAIQPLRALIIGQKLAIGTGPVDTPVLGYSQDQVNGLAGVNSMLANMYAAYRAQDPFGECWVLPVADAAAGLAGASTIVVAGPATAVGTIVLYVGGVAVPVSVNSGDASTAIATNIAAAINNTGMVMPVTASVASSTVTVTADHKGAAAADIDLRVNYYGARNGEVLPPGVTLTITTTVVGTTNPVLTAGLANCGEMPFDFIANPYTDAVSLTALENFLSDQSGRWSAIEMLYGHVFTAYRGTVAARSSFGNGRNSQHVSCLGFYDSPTPAWLEAADFAGAHAARIRVNPAMGVTDQALNLLAPPVASRDTPASRNVLLYDGVSTFFVDAAGQSRIDRSITMWQTNPSGQIDDSYLQTNLMFQAAYSARYIKSQLTSMYIAAGKILVEDGTPIPPGAPATTPSTIFQSTVAIYAYLASVFVVQDVATFAKNGYARKGQKGQVLLYLPINFSDQLVQIACLVQFRQTT
jgi:phage tail sheath gpL-like